MKLWQQSVHQADGCLTFTICVAIRLSAPTSTPIPTGIGWWITCRTCTPAQAIVAGQVANFVKYPPRQKAASFNLDTVMASLGPAQAAAAKAKAEAAAAAKAAAAKK